MKNANLTNRTNLRLHLQRQQAQNEEKREQLQYSQSLKNTYKSNVIDMPPAPVQKSEVPPQILQVSMMCNFKSSIITGHPQNRNGCLTLLHSEQPKLYGVLAVLSAIGLNSKMPKSRQTIFKSKTSYCSYVRPTQSGPIW